MRISTSINVMSGNDGSRWRRVSELPPQRPKQDGENSNTLNSRHSTGGFGAGLPQKKRVLATTTATAVTTMSKRRMSMKNRRVSFAPDPELTTIREFEKEERESPSLQEQQGVAQLPEGDPMMISPPQVPASGFGNPSNRRVSFGDITAGLPTLGELAEEEEHGDVPVGAFGTAGAADVAQQYQDLDNVTHQVPGLGALLEEDEILEESIGKANQQQPARQENKWGFMPGNDDTLDVDLKGHGRMFMGDKTYSKMYADNVTENSLASVEAGPSAEKSVQNVERVSFGGEVRGPRWAAPAFGPSDAANAHPALDKSSPNFTDSSLGTASTRRVSVDARRMSVSSRRVSMLGGVGGAGTAAGGEGAVNAAADNPAALAQNSASLRVHDANPDEYDDEEDLLADNSPRSMNVKTFDVLAGLKTRMSALSPPKNSRRSSMLPVPEDSEMRAESFHSPTGSGAHIMNRSPPASAASLGNGHSSRRQSIMSIGNGRRSFAAYGNPRESIGGSMGRTTPGSITRRTSLNTVNTGGTTVFIGGNHANNSNNANNGVLSTPMRTNALESTVNPEMASSASRAPPGSAIAARYPGSAVATGRMSQGFTPSTLPPITFQDFAKIVEVQFLDNLRRGASINYADLQPNPVPGNVKESLSLLCITQPNIEELETAISTLQSEIQRLRGSAADLEVMLGQTNPAIFRHVQTSSYEQLEALRNNVASLKKACRAKATALLKDVRCQMEASKHGRLTRALEGLKGDVTWFHQIKGHTQGISKAAKDFVAQKREYMAAKRREFAAQAELSERLRAKRKAAADITAANKAREEQLMTIESTANNVDSELTKIEAERVELEAEIQHGLAVVQNASVSVAKARQSFSSTQQTEALLLEDENTVASKLNMLKLHEKCSGMKIQSCRALHGAFSCSINVADAFIMELNYAEGSDGVTIVVNPRGSRNEFAMKLFSQRDNCSFSCEREALTCVIQALVTQMTQAANTAKELYGIRAACPNICELTPVSSQYDALGHRAQMAVRIGCLGMQLGVRFSVTLAVKDLSCLDIDVVFGSEVVGIDQIKGALLSVSDVPSPRTKGLGGVCGSLCGTLVV